MVQTELNQHLRLCYKHTGVCRQVHNLEDPPYKIGNGYGALSTKTMPMTAIHKSGVREYNAHNLYGLAEAAATAHAAANITSKRPFVLTRCDLQLFAIVRWGLGGACQKLMYAVGYRIK